MRIDVKKIRQLILLEATTRGIEPAEVKNLMLKICKTKKGKRIKKAQLYAWLTGAETPSYENAVRLRKFFQLKSIEDILI